MIVGAVIVAIFAGALLLTSSQLSDVESIALFIGLLVPLGAQAAYGWYMLRQGVHPNN